MRLLIQRVRHASVAVGGDICSQIGPGLLALVGVGVDDGDEDIEYLAGKLVRLRVFDDEAGDGADGRFVGAKLCGQRIEELTAQAEKFSACGYC